MRVWEVNRIGEQKKRTWTVPIGFPTPEKRRLTKAHALTVQQQSYQCQRCKAAVVREEEGAHEVEPAQQAFLA